MNCIANYLTRAGCYFCAHPGNAQRTVLPEPDLCSSRTPGGVCCLLLLPSPLILCPSLVSVFLLPPSASPLLLFPTPSLLSSLIYYFLLLFYLSKESVIFCEPVFLNFSLDLKAESSLKNHFQGNLLCFDLGSSVSP